VDVLRGTGRRDADVALSIKHDGGQSLLVLDDPKDTVETR
jgi:hypothetical protein